MAEKGTLELSFEAGQVLKTFGQTGRGGWGRKGIAEEKPRAQHSEAPLIVVKQDRKNVGEAASTRVCIKHC